MSLNLMIEDTLRSIDNFFKEKSQKDIYMIYIMLIAVMATLAYPFYDLSVNEFKTVKDKISNIKVKINSDKVYLKVNTEAKIVKLNQKIKELQNELQDNKENNQYIKHKIETISSLIYDERTWGEYLNSISVKAKKHDIKIINFTNKYTDSNNSFGHVLDIMLQVKGNYSDTVKFINSLEQSELVVDVHDLSMKTQDKLNTKLNISVWGITY